MQRIINNRNTGKTSQLMLLAKESNATFVCSNPRAMEIKAKSYKITGLNFISYADFIQHFMDYDSQNYVIDEIETFIRNTLFLRDNKLVGYTLSIEE